jgi:Acyl-protein synthetase, LuxE
VSLEAELAAAIRVSDDVGGFPFEDWALRVFAHQFAHNSPYRAFCERRRVTPGTVASWEGVPPVPTAAFRTADLACGPAEAVFRTSGTSAGHDARGRHLVPHLDLYRTAALATFARFLLPDRARLPALVLLPPPVERPDSSLVRMCAWIEEELAASAEWFGALSRLDVSRLLRRLREAESAGEAVMLIGPTAGFVRLFDAGASFRLGPGSRLMDTGGAKGMARPLSRAGFLRACWTQLGIAGYFCINEYGMTELCSQRYESVLRDRFAGRSLDARRLVAPPWLRTRVLDPDTLSPVAAGTVGLLCHHDLANAGSVSVVLTEDLGRCVGEDGIEVVGRVPGAPPRGCGTLLADLAHEPGG